MKAERNYGDRYHLIDQRALEEKKLDREALEQFVKDSNMQNMGKKYNVVSIIGSQSTGKSTLLNKVFGTQFAVQDRTKNMGQTTVGIWLARDQSQNTVVLDVEGSDSVERRASDNMIENQTALLALAMSHAFLINVFLNSLGQHTSCQLSIIKVIMQMNLKLFSQDTVKHIIFVVRDWEEEANIEEATERLHGYLLHIWKDIPKPDNMQELQFEQLFKVQVFTLSYFKMKPQFDKETLQLREKVVNPEDPNFLFKGFDYEKNLPIEALPFYLTNIWETIANNKDLNLPNEKILVSNMRCQQIKADCLELVKPQIEKLNASLHKDKVDKFGEQCIQIIKIANEKYVIESRDYHKDVILEKKAELATELKNKFYTMFQKQSDHIKQEHLSQLQSELGDLRTLQDIYQLPPCLAELDASKNNFAAEIKDSLLEVSIWNEDDHIKQFNQQFDQLIRQFVENQLTQYKQQLDNLIKGECDKIVGNQIINIGSKFWPQIDMDYNDLIKTRFERYDKLMEDLQVNQKFKSDYLDKFEGDSFNSLKQILNQHSARIKDQLFQQFKQQFCRTTEGQPREWKKMTEEEIFHTFTDVKDGILKLLDMLRIRKIKCQKISQLRVTKKYQSAISIGAKPQETETMSFDNDDILISDVYYSQIKTQLLEDFDVQYQDAIQKHKQDFLQNIPKPFWFLLLFFMYDDVFRWMGNPLVLYPILIIICFVGFCIAIGFHSLPKLVFQHVIKSVNGLVGPLLFGGLSKLKSS